MRKIINLQIINTACPAGMSNKNCPVQKYLDGQNLFHVTINESLYEPTEPYAAARDKYIAAMDSIFNMCAKCKAEHTK